jgi:hypothetical protein
MKHISTLFVASVLMITLIGVLQAEDIQWAQGFTADCDNPTEREDGTPLSIEEIARVEYYLDPVDGNLDTPAYTAIMAGGCQPTFIDTKQLSVGDYWAYARTYDTDLLDSVASTPGIPKHIQKSRPKAAKNLR